MGYKDFFDYELDISKYINSGCIIFNESHKDFINSFKQLYYDNREPLMEMQDKIVMKGTEQTPLNYWLQMKNIDVKTNLPLPFKLTHLHRKDLLGSNWQLKEDPTPFFIKYGYIWFFNGIPKDQRTNIMMNTWNATKDYYKESNIEFTKILDEVKHKDTAKYTTSRKFKYDLLNTFSDEKYKEMSVLELGCSQGMTTRVLSYIFNKVYAVDWDTWNLEQAKKHCAGRDNIEFSQKDVYGGTWDFPNSEVVFIDCDHVYQSVISDIENSLSNFGDPIFIFDDYGLPPGEVKRAIKDKESEGKLKIDKYIGELPENLEHAGGTKFIDVEGCICNLR
jgi:SAM-dependent methyltransferase